MGEIVFLLILAVGAAILYIITGSFPVNALDSTGGAAMFPRAVLIVLLILLIIRFFQLLRTKEREKFVFSELFQGSTGIFLLSIFLYILLFSVLGYIVSTILYAVITVSYCYYKKHGSVGGIKKIAIRTVVSVAGTLVLFWFFTDILSVRMPVGPLGL